jgi:hypothetical protein
MLTHLDWPGRASQFPDDCVVASGLAAHVLQRVVEIIEEPERNNVRLVLGPRINREEVGPDTLIITCGHYRIGFTDERPGHFPGV